MDDFAFEAVSLPVPGPYGEEVSHSDWQYHLESVLAGDRAAGESIATIAGCLSKLEFSSAWCANPKLYFLLHKLVHLDIFDEILGSGITDLWLPLPHRTLIRWMSDEAARDFLLRQESTLDTAATSHCAGSIVRNSTGWNYLVQEVSERCIVSRIDRLDTSTLARACHGRWRIRDTRISCKTSKESCRACAEFAIYIAST